MNSISCATTGNCTVVGSYENTYGQYTGFLVDETNGGWGSAIRVPGMPSLNTGGDASVSSVSCASAGDCSAGGYYTGDAGLQAFVVDKTNGVWGNAIRVPGMGALRNRGGTSLNSLSCAAAGECAAGGEYLDRRRNRQAFVVDETNGAWGKAIEVPGTATLNTGGIAVVNSISCAAPGSCVAGGSYRTTSHYRRHAFVVNETNGSWSKAVDVPGAILVNGNAAVSSVSCPASGHCTAGGSYSEHHLGRVFVVSRPG